MRTALKSVLWIMLAAVSCGREDVLETMWVSTDIHFTDRISIEEIEDAKTPAAFRHPAWKGERIWAQLLIRTIGEADGVRIGISDLKSGNDVIPSEMIEAGFVKYVMGDVFADSFSQCGERPVGKFDSLMVADMVDNCEYIDLKDNALQPIWITVKVPENAAAGHYEGRLTVKAKGIRARKVPFKIEVLDRTLPSPEEWKFYLDLWQNPYSVARYHNVELWSKEHFDHMRPVMQKLADAGQKVITATIMNRPWNGQTEDAYGPMVTKTLKADGTWKYDYEVFDRWVEWMMSLGIDSYINCYSMIPWELEFDYYEEGCDTLRTMRAAPEEKAYSDYWTPFIKDFESHLKEKGWFGITRIAMDERPVPRMLEAIRIIRQASPEMGISLAGGRHPEIEAELTDYCVSFLAEHPVPISERRARGDISTWYTCCAEKYPNTFTISPLSEAAWIGWRTLAADYDGYLRWAVNSWTADPMTDTRFRTWCAGDTYMIYPDGRSSLRFDKLVEGIQDYEKMRILIDEWNAADQLDKVAELTRALSRFDYKHLSESASTGREASEAIEEGRRVYNKLNTED
ncbi:MAG: DUF6067 family protein [Bacteroidales bacterium]|nr:DUF6067 family protein [Bacteroidales bacterium]MDY2859465.1 DUF6067 family protein [Candidatus Cryptobacteroides sp.]MDY5442587.1 DUF6067 family protein [Candidatus Cryptobacteroides sp.]